MNENCDGYLNQIVPPHLIQAEPTAFSAAPPGSILSSVSEPAFQLFLQPPPPPPQPTVTVDLAQPVILNFSTAPTQAPALALSQPQQMQHDTEVQSCSYSSNPPLVTKYVHTSVEHCSQIVVDQGLGFPVNSHLPLFAPSPDLQLIDRRSDSNQIVITDVKTVKDAGIMIESGKTVQVTLPSELNGWEGQAHSSTCEAPSELPMQLEGCISFPATLTISSNPNKLEGVVDILPQKAVPTEDTANIDALAIPEVQFDCSGAIGTLKENFVAEMNRNLSESMCAKEPEMEQLTDDSQLMALVNVLSKVPEPSSLANTPVLVQNGSENGDAVLSGFQGGPDGSSATMSALTECLNLGLGATTEQILESDSAISSILSSGCDVPRAESPLPLSSVLELQDKSDSLMAPKASSPSMCLLANSEPFSPIPDAAGCKEAEIRTVSAQTSPTLELDAPEEMPTLEAAVEEEAASPSDRMPELEKYDTPQGDAESKWEYKANEEGCSSEEAPPSSAQQDGESAAEGSSRSAEDLPQAANKSTSTDDLVEQQESVAPPILILTYPNDVHVIQPPLSDLVLQNKDVALQHAPPMAIVQPQVFLQKDEGMQCTAQEEPKDQSPIEQKPAIREFIQVEYHQSQNGEKQKRREDELLKLRKWRKVPARPPEEQNKESTPKPVTSTQFLRSLRIVRKPGTSTPQVISVGRGEPASLPTPPPPPCESASLPPPPPCEPAKAIPSKAAAPESPTKMLQVSLERLESNRLYRKYVADGSPVGHRPSTAATASPVKEKCPPVAVVNDTRLKKKPVLLLTKLTDQHLQALGVKIKEEELCQSDVEDCKSLKEVRVEVSRLPPEVIQRYTKKVRKPRTKFKKNKGILKRVTLDELLMQNACKRPRMEEDQPDASPAEDDRPLVALSAIKPEEEPPNKSQVSCGYCWQRFPSLPVFRIHCKKEHPGSVVKFCKFRTKTAL